jgi:putative hydrolase of the HAD superfamily
MNAYDHLIFDLDDTLLDTFGLLLPQASREACVKMIDAGLKSSVDQCMIAREEIAQTSGRTDLFENIVHRFGGVTGREAQAIAAAGFKAFYDRKVESNISFFPGLRDTLHDLRDKYGVHLVTSGHPDTQAEKLRILDANGLFDSVTIVNSFAGETKDHAFKAVASRTGSDPARHLSIGNRLDTDIAPAKRLGWRTCWVKYGEYAQSKPANEFEIADVTINSIKELITACRL